VPSRADNPRGGRRTGDDPGVAAIIVPSVPAAHSPPPRAALPLP
jgi:hypothetical protein